MVVEIEFLYETAVFQHFSDFFFSVALVNLNRFDDFESSSIAVKFAYIYNKVKTNMNE